MKASSKITKVELWRGIFGSVPVAAMSGELHSSFLRAESGYRIILICPECWSEV